MDTAAFLQAILPTTGVYYLGLMQEGRPGVAHRPFTSISVMASAVAKLDAMPGVTVYHACGSDRKSVV